MRSRVSDEGLAKLELKESERPKIDPEFEVATEGDEVDRKEKLKGRWSQIKAVLICRTSFVLQPGRRHWAAPG